jgi:hypothetical protein
MGRAPRDELRATGGHAAVKRFAAARDDGRVVVHEEAKPTKKSRAGVAALKI